MSGYDQQVNSRNSRSGSGSDPVLAEGANPMQSMDLGVGKHAAAGECSDTDNRQLGRHTAHSMLGAALCVPAGRQHQQRS